MLTLSWQIGRGAEFRLNKWSQDANIRKVTQFGTTTTLGNVRLHGNNVNADVTSKFVIVSVR